MYFLILLQVEKFNECMEMVSDVMYLHYHGNLSQAIPAEELSRHRVAFLGLAVFVVQLLKAMVPAEQVDIIQLLFSFLYRV